MTPEEIVANAIKQAQDVVDYETRRTLSFLGEQCVKRVRERPAEESWCDITGNLRNSIGFGVMKKQEIQSVSDFPQGEGAIAGQALIRQVAANNNYPYLLTLVAGMNYAGFVEAKTNKDVLASTELWARQKMPEYLEKTKSRIERILARL